MSAALTRAPENARPVSSDAGILKIIISPVRSPAIVTAVSAEDVAAIEAGLIDTVPESTGDKEKDAFPEMKPLSDLTGPLKRVPIGCAIEKLLIIGVGSYPTMFKPGVMRRYSYSTPVDS